MLTKDILHRQTGFVKVFLQLTPDLQAPFINEKEEADNHFLFCLIYTADHPTSYYFLSAPDLPKYISSQTAESSVTDSTTAPFSSRSTVALPSKRR